ncbi:unnamed protein product [Echinostoma caproni]|uniref:G_PROTEIN_RECEP_F1_2 domain-containing protein n=1 Tax=Echinostoma caproni TaxID=27848 RepID=A0A183B578_9TREM|nr:unnamed protein product [Echinostoma caproni]
MESNRSLIFSFQFYHHVEYLGSCGKINDSRMFGNEPALPTLYAELPGLVLTFIALILNGLSLIVFCVDEWGGLRLRSCSPESTSAADKTTRSTVIASTDATHANPNVSFGLSKRSNVAGSKRSSVTLSLLLLCACECTYAFGKTVFRTSLFTTPYAISATIDSMDVMESMKRRIEVLPVLQNLFFFISDVGLMCRNWCVCLITIARAEVVMWPLGSRRWQRILRTRRWFFVSFLVILNIAIVFAYLKHSDFVGNLCFDPARMQFALWMHEFTMSQSQFESFELFGYHMLQSCLAWCLIFVFTLIIIIRLKPWKQDVDKLFSSLKQSPAHQSLKSNPAAQSVSAQADAMRRRQRSQIRATRVVIVIVVMFVVLEFVTFVSVCFQFAGIVGAHSPTMRTLESVANTMVTADSIGNFIVFILTLKQFRIMCLQLFCCRKRPITPSTSVAMHTPGQISTGNNVGQSSVVVSTERTQIELE